jgi:uronate dehydrogenase
LLDIPYPEQSNILEGSTMATLPIKRLLITGAAGALGREARAGLRGIASAVRLSDIAAMAPAQAQHNEEVVVCDLADASAVDALCEGVDAILHLGGQATEAPWPQVMQANIAGVINLYEAARKAGVGRILFASSNHAIGFHRRTERLDHSSPARPDGRYGVSKAFGEDIASLYANKYGIKGFCMRIGSCFPEPTTKRMLSTWLSYADFVRLARAGLTAHYHYEIVYGVSANTRSWWDNNNAARLGYDPQDNAEVFAAKVANAPAEDPIAVLFQGTTFASEEFIGTADRVP